MDKTIKISVVIPVYNQTQALSIVLRFFGYQTLDSQDYEVIVVDDGSTPAVSESIRLEDYSYSLKILRQDNAGRSCARNFGVENSKGKWIVFCDGDRIPAADFLESHLAFQQKNGPAAVFGCPWDCFYSLEKLKKSNREQLRIIKKFSRKPEYYKKVTALFKDGKSTSSIAWAAFLVGNSSLFKADFISAGGFDESFKTWGFEHFDLALRLQENNVPIGHCEEAASFHIPHPRSRDFFEKNIKLSMKILNEKYPQRDVDSLKDFMLGEISLQDFELRYGKAASGMLTPNKSLYFQRFLYN